MWLPLCFIGGTIFYFILLGFLKSNIDSTKQGS